MKKDEKTWRGYLLAILAASLWATLGLFAKSLYAYAVDPAILITLRSAIAAITLGGALLIFRPGLLRLQLADLPLFIGYGLIGVALNYLCFFMALKWMSITTAVFLLYLYPALVVLGAVLFLKETLTRAKLIALTTALLGSALVAQVFDPAALALNVAGVLFSLGAALTMAFYALLGKHSLKRYPGWTVIFYGIGIAALGLLIWQGTELKTALRYPWQAWLLILGVAWIPTLLAYSSFTMSLTYIQAGHAAILTNLEPVLAAGLAYILLGERLSILQGAGAILILAGILLLQFNRVLTRRKEVMLGNSTN